MQSNLWGSNDTSSNPAACSRWIANVSDLWPSPQSIIDDTGDIITAIYSYLQQSTANYHESLFRIYDRRNYCVLDSLKSRSDTCRDTWTTGLYKHLTSVMGAVCRCRRKCGPDAFRGLRFSWTLGLPLPHYHLTLVGEGPFLTHCQSQYPLRYLLGHGLGKGWRQPTPLPHSACA